LAPRRFLLASLTGGLDTTHIVEGPTLPDAPADRQGRVVEQKASCLSGLGRFGPRVARLVESRASCVKIIVQAEAQRSPEEFGTEADINDDHAIP